MSQLKNSNVSFTCNVNQRPIRLRDKSSIFCNFKNMIDERKRQWKLKLGKDIIILGDLNCDMLSPTEPECLILSELCSLLNLIQLISSTRVTETTESLIDVILTSNKNLIKQSNVLQTTIGNHFLAFCKLTLKRPKSVPPTITTRNFKNFNTEAFCKDISETPFDTVNIFN